MTDYIEVTVRVPADLEVNHEVGYMIRDAGREKVNYIPGSQNWGEQVFQQIAAAIEARKPRPPLFQVGDVVEWTDPHNGPQAGFVREVDTTNGPFYFLHGYRLGFFEASLKLVRRAEK